MVGISSALLAAGALCVLATLWAIDDEATLLFMRDFNQHLKEGKTTNAALQQSMKSLRESDKFSDIRYCVPFQLIGVDVKFEFDADEDEK